MLVHINLGRDAVPHYLPSNALCDGGGRLSDSLDDTEVFSVSADLSDDDEFADFT